jgi:hypothetical protein
LNTEVERRDAGYAERAAQLGGGVHCDALCPRSPGLRAYSAGSDTLTRDAMRALTRLSGPEAEAVAVFEMPDDRNRARCAM